MKLTDRDMRLIEGWQRGFPLVPRPYDEIGRALGMAEAEVIEALARLKAAGVLSRVGAAVRANTAGASTLAPVRPSRCGSHVDKHRPTEIIECPEWTGGRLLRLSGQNVLPLGCARMRALPQNADKR